MHTELFSPTLPTPRQQLALQRLLALLLPPLPKLHRCLANEVNYLTTTISRITLQRLDFRVERAQMVETLKTMGYVFFVKGETNARPPVKPLTPLELAVYERDGALTGDDIGSTEEEVFVYVNVDGKVARALRCTTIPTPQNMSLQKLALRQDLEQKLEALAQEIRHIPLDG